MEEVFQSVCVIFYLVQCPYSVSTAPLLTELTWFTNNTENLNILF